MRKSLLSGILVAALAHGLLITLVGRVGLAVPLPRKGVEFFYCGSLAVAEGLAGPWGQVRPPPLPLDLNGPDPAFFAPWMQMRQLNKPRD